MRLPNRGVRTHGLSKTPLYRIWGLIKHRCNNPNNPAYPRYGGRGIKMCERWQLSFEVFAADVGPRPTPQHSIDRYPDPNGHYEPGNVRWATATEQARNQRSNRLFTINGETLTLAEWAERHGKSFRTVFQRLAYGWPIEVALTASHYCRRPEGVQMPDALAWIQAAQCAVRVAIREGRVIKPPTCQHPGCEETELHAHHWHGYRHSCWEDVIFLCPKHHKQAEATSHNDAAELGEFVPDEKPYTGREVARLMGIGETAFWRRAGEGRIPGAIPGTAVRKGYDRATIDAWILSRQEKGQDKYS